MKKTIKKVIVRIVTFLLISGLTIVGMVLNPSLLYAKNTQIGNITVYHQQTLPPFFAITLQKSLISLSKSAIYDQNYALELCLNDGSIYPEMIGKLKGAAFGHGFYNKVILTAEANYEKNEVELYSRKWQLDQLIAHEMIHCHQFNTNGWSTLSIPSWKLEGYAEFISRNKTASLQSQLMEFEQLTKTNSSGWIDFENGTGTVTQYEQDRLLVHYLITVKQWSYDQILQDTTPKLGLEQELKTWYQNQVQR